MFYILIWWVYLFILFVLLPFYLIRGFVCLCSRDIEKTIRAKRYFVVSSLLFVLLVVTYMTIALHVQSALNSSETFL
jgi:D-alanyl-lipoteichoic acid acyltransferase DltB (MBOAT superfamily)